VATVLRRKRRPEHVDARVAHHPSPAIALRAAVLSAKRSAFVGRTMLSTNKDIAHGFRAAVQVSDGSHGAHDGPVKDADRIVHESQNILGTSID
jgi:hypothetical protein